MSPRTWTVGVDFGGTAVKIGLVDARGCVTATSQLASQLMARPAEFVSGLGRAVEALTASVGIRPSRLLGIGVGAPGPVDAQRGVVRSLVNVPGWRDVPLRERLERRLGCRCAVENDANLFALGEWRYGAGRDARQLIGLTLGTGVGGGLIFDGALFRGAAGAAGEIGHMVIDPHGSRCACGARGCLEAHVGTAALVRLARRAIRRGRGPLRALARDARGTITPALISEAARRGDPSATKIWEAVGGWLGLGLASLVNVLDPDRIVIGGGVANAWRWFAPRLLQTVREQAMPVSAARVRIVRAQLGERAGIVGAAVLIHQRGSGRHRFE